MISRKVDISNYADRQRQAEYRVDTVAPRLPDDVAAASVPQELGPATVEALLGDRSTLKGLLRFCLWHLGSHATPEDAEDALQDFCARNSQKITNTYKPGPQSLKTYFKFCLRRFCWKRAKQLRQHRKQTRLMIKDLNTITLHRDPGPLIRLLTDADGQRHEKIVSRLQEAIGELSPDAQRLLKLFYEERLSIREISEKHLHISESAVKVRLTRVRSKLKLLIAATRKGEL
jgi:RNA polymerase sigma factor (sigma-70 family)